jgi:hypothetical protein
MWGRKAKRESEMFARCRCSCALRKPRPDADDTVRWINVDGLNWTILSELAETYNLHPLALEDMMHVPQRPKADFYGAPYPRPLLSIRLLFFFGSVGLSGSRSCAV